jgi:L-fuconolactonase
MIIDAHFHSWQLARNDYGWLTPAMGRIYRDVDVPHWMNEARACGVQAGVLVQAAPTEAETQHLLQLADAHTEVLGVVGWVDLCAADAVQRIDKLAQGPKLKGLRPMLQDIAQADWILQAAVQPGLQRMAELGLVLDALVKPVHLPHVLTLAARHPTLPIVIDHGAKPDIAAGVHAAWQPWADLLERLAQCPNVVCKLSGLLTEAGPDPASDAARTWAHHVLATFGPQRVLWGSDWPVLELAASYADWWQECQAIVATDALVRAAVFGGNAQRVYRLASGPV